MTFEGRAAAKMTPEVLEQPSPIIIKTQRMHMTAINGIDLVNMFRKDNAFKRTAV
jgi:hypothetical protein